MSSRASSILAIGAICFQVLRITALSQDPVDLGDLKLLDETIESSIQVELEFVSGTLEDPDAALTWFNSEIGNKLNLISSEHFLIIGFPLAYPDGKNIYKLSSQLNLISESIPDSHNLLRINSSGGLSNRLHRIYRALEPGAPKLSDKELLSLNDARKTLWVPDDPAVLLAGKEPPNLPTWIHSRYLAHPKQNPLSSKDKAKVEWALTLLDNYYQRLPKTRQTSAQTLLEAANFSGKIGTTYLPTSTSWNDDSGWVRISLNDTAGSPIIYLDVKVVQVRRNWIDWEFLGSKSWSLDIKSSRQFNDVQCISQGTFTTQDFLPGYVTKLVLFRDIEVLLPQLPSGFSKIPPLGIKGASICGVVCKETEKMPAPDRTRFYFEK